MNFAELIQSANDGTLRVIDSIECLPKHLAILVMQANFGDVNAAISLADQSISEDWSWRIGYDNKADLARKEQIEGACNDISVISISPAHALMVACLQAMQQNLAAKTTGVN